MNSQVFIISEIKKFIELFPQTKVRYENHIISNTHFIEVLPNSVYHLNEEYIKWEEDMFDSFVQIFPNENICFISDDAKIELANIDFEIKGKNYECEFSFFQNTGILIKSPQIIYNNTKSNYSLTPNSACINKNATVDVMIKEYISINVNLNTSNSKTLNVSSNIESIDSNNYIMNSPLAA